MEFGSLPQVEGAAAPCCSPLLLSFTAQDSCSPAEFGGSASKFWIMSSVSVILEQEANINMNWVKRLIPVVMLAPALAAAQQTCASGVRVMGTTTVSTGASIPGAQVQVGSGEKTTTDVSGHYVLTCVPATSPEFGPSWWRCYFLHSGPRQL